MTTGPVPLDPLLEGEVTRVDTAGAAGVVGRGVVAHPPAGPYHLSYGG